jgi:DNA repair protein RadC
MRNGYVRYYETGGYMKQGYTYEVVSERKVKYTVAIKHPSDVLPLLRRYAKDQEHNIVITLNGAHEVISVVVVSIGLVNRAIVHPREVYRKAIYDNAVAIIYAHNHPSGQLEPSPEDLSITERLSETSNIIGIRLLDSIIFSKKDYTSLRQQGYVTDEITNGYK